MIDNTDYCIFCTKPKNWDSNIRITDNNDRLIFKATICRDCKKQYKIDDLFKRYAQLVEHEYQLAQPETKTGEQDKKTVDEDIETIEQDAEKTK